MFRPPPFRLLPAALAAGLLLAVSPAAAPAQDDTGGDAADPFVADAVTLIPADAGVVVRVADPDSAVTHLRAFARNAAPQFEGQLMAARAVLGMGVQNVTLSGVNMKQPWYVVALPRDDAPPATVYLLPIANAEAMKAALPPSMTVKVIGTYAAYGDVEDEVLDRFGESGGFVDTLPEGAMELSAAYDIAVAVNVPRLLSVYGDKLEEQLDQIKEAAAGQAAGPEAAANQAKAIDAFVALLQDAGGTVVGFKADENALSFKKISVFDDGSDVSDALALQTPTAFAALGKLPEELDGYAAFNGDLTPLTEFAQDVSGEDTPQQDLMAAMVEAGLSASAGGFKLGGSSLINGVQVATVEDVTVAKAAVQRYITEADGAEQMGLRTTVEDAGTMTVGGVTLQKFITDLEAVEDTEEAEAAEKAFKMMFGAAGQEQMVAYLDRTVLQINGGDDAFVREAVGHASGTESHPNDALDAVAAMLPKSGNLFAAIDLASVARTGLLLAMENDAFPAIFPAETVENVAIGRSYAAFVVTVKGNQIIAEGVIPAEQVRNVVDFGTALQGGAEQF